MDPRSAAPETQHDDEVLVTASVALAATQEDRRPPVTWPWWIVLGAATGSLAIAESGGFDVRWPLLHISAHNPRPLAVIASVVALTAVSWRRRLTWTTDLPALPQDVRRYADAWVLALAAGATIVALVWNTWTIGGSDSHCYAAQARAFAAGHLHLIQPLALNAPWPKATRTFAPVGFLPAPTMAGEFIPICAPGFSLLLAPLIRLWPPAPFLVSPFAAALFVWVASRLGRALDDGLGGVGAAALAMTTPVLLYQAVQPMTDVFTAAAIGGAAVCTWVAPRRPALAGTLLGVALLSRPNLLPVAVPLVLAHSIDAHRRDRSWFLVTLIPIAALVPALNTLVYGAPFASGYGDTASLFALRHIPTNLLNYGRATVETMTPVVAIGLAAPWLIRRQDIERRKLARALLFTMSLVAACYLAYLSFEEWWYLRFLLPAVPLLCALTGAALSRLARRAGAAGPPLLIATIGIVSCHGLLVARDREVFHLWRLEQRLSATASYVGAAVPNAAVIAVQPSGAVNYQLRQPIVSWDSLEPGRLAEALQWLGSLGLHPLVVVDAAEIESFRRRFEPFSQLGALDWPPRAVVFGSVRVFDPADRARFLAGIPIETVSIAAPASRR